MGKYQKLQFEVFDASQRRYSFFLCYEKLASFLCFHVQQIVLYYWFENYDMRLFLYVINYRFVSPSQLTKLCKPIQTYTNPNTLTNSLAKRNIDNTMISSSLCSENLIRVDLLSVYLRNARTPISPAPYEFINIQSFARRAIYQK